MNISQLYNAVRNLFCRHDYELVNQFEMMSEFDIAVINKKTPHSWLSLQRKVVTDYKCKKCSNIKRFESMTPN